MRTYCRQGSVQDRAGSNGAQMMGTVIPAGSETGETTTATSIMQPMTGAGDVPAITGRLFEWSGLSAER